MLSLEAKIHTKDKDFPRVGQGFPTRGTSISHTWETLRSHACVPLQLLLLLLKKNAVMPQLLFIFKPKNGNNPHHSHLLSPEPSPHKYFIFNTLTTKGEGLRVSEGKIFKNETAFCYFWIEE